MTDQERTIGTLLAEVSNLKDVVDKLNDKVDAVTDTLSQYRGGLNMLLLGAGGVSSGATVLLAKFMGFLNGTPPAHGN